ncbi:hypothetical protein GCM10023320_28440 [Pseudonocardia adelaidensis]|uniref:Thioesterase superfamily protein n=1 Tax=Pseudonocardia adelaidensis TaxID=648754 RepID=A0ABP9NJP4_9PSEU
MKAMDAPVVPRSGELDGSPFVRSLRIQRCDDRNDLRLDASGLGAGAGRIGALAAAAVLAARSRMAQWQLHHGMERSRPVSVQIALFGQPARTGTFHLSTAMARRSEGRGFCDVRIAEGGGRRAGQATVVLAAGLGASSREAADLPGPPAPTAAGVCSAGTDSLATRGMALEAVGNGAAVVLMPPIANNLDADGRVHEGAVLALIDAAGTHAISAAATGPVSRTVAVSLHASVLRPLSNGALSAYSVVRACDGLSAWCDIEVVGLADRQLYGIGTVVALI